MTADRSVQFHTPRLVLRPTVPADVERALEIRSDPEVARNLVSATIPPDPEKMTGWFGGHADEWREGTAYRLAITLEGRMIGVCDVFDIANGEGEIGYWLDRAAWGHGFGCEAAARLVRFAFDELGLTTLVAGCADDPYDGYCTAVEANQQELTEILAEGGPDVLLRALPVFRELRDEAPDDIEDDWDVVVGGLANLEAALEDADVDPAAYDREDPPKGLSQAEQDRIDAAAEDLASERSVAAFAAVEQQARDVCRTPLRL